LPHGDITFDPSDGDVFPCPAPNCEEREKKKRNHYFASTDCLPLQNLTQASQHAGATALNTFLYISNKFQMPPELKYGNEVRAQYILYLLTRWR
jgi:hypothetical protein